MIPVARPPEPALFDERARRPGNHWLIDNPEAARPRDYWSAFRNQLMEAFGHRCGYTALLDVNGTVDHFRSFAKARHLAYEWSNYRYASQWVNSSKKTTDADLCLDPFDVENGWFEVLLPSLELVIVPERVPPHLLERAAETLRRLPIGRHPRVLETRRFWYEQFRAGKINLEQLHRYAPQIAAAVEKAQRAG